jgi:hypothetical protein
MAANKLFKITFPTAQATKYFKRVEKENDIAISRALNTISKQALSETAKEVAEDTGLSQARVKKSVKVTKATRFNHGFEWDVSGSRLGLIKPKTTRGGAPKRGGNRTGISFLSHNKERKRITESIDGGTKPFLIPVSRGAKKKIAVYRKRGSRKVTKLAYHSIPVLIREDWFERTMKALTKRLPGEYRKQLKKAKYN